MAAIVFGAAVLIGYHQGSRARGASWVAAWIAHGERASACLPREHRFGANTALAASPEAGSSDAPSTKPYPAEDSRSSLRDMELRPSRDSSREPWRLASFPQVFPTHREHLQRLRRAMRDNCPELREPSAKPAPNPVHQPDRRHAGMLHRPGEAVLHRRSPRPRPSSHSAPSTRDGRPGARTGPALRHRRRNPTESREHRPPRRRTCRRRASSSRGPSRGRPSA